MNIQKISVKIEGIVPYISNEFVSISEPDIPVEKKIRIEDGKIVIDKNRIMSFLTANNPKTGKDGCIKLFTKSTEYKKLLPRVDAYVGITPEIIPISDNDKYIVREDKVGGGGVPAMVKRPMIEKWGAEFTISLTENPSISFEKLEGWFERGGIEVGLGAWRPRYGRFIVKEFKKIK